MTQRHIDYILNNLNEDEDPDNLILPIHLETEFGLSLCALRDLPDDWAFDEENSYDPCCDIPEEVIERYRWNTPTAIQEFQDKLYLIGHDWGGTWAYRLHRR